MNEGDDSEVVVMLVSTGHRGAGDGSEWKRF